MKKYKSFISNLIQESIEIKNADDAKIFAFKYDTNEQCKYIALILKTLYEFEIYDYDGIMNDIGNMEYDCFIWNGLYFVQDTLTSTVHRWIIKLEFDDFNKFISEPMNIKYNTNPEVDPFEEEDWGYTIEESKLDSPSLDGLPEQFCVKVNNEQEVRDLMDFFNSLNIKFRGGINPLEYSFSPKYPYIYYNYYGNQRQQRGVLLHGKHADITEIPLKTILTNKDGFDKRIRWYSKGKFRIEPQVYDIKESKTDTIEGEIKIQEYTSTWENIFKTRYRNLANGEVKDIKKLLDGPIAMISDGIKMFNGGEDCDINIIHNKKMDIIEICPNKASRDELERKLKMTKDHQKVWDIRMELKRYKEKIIRFPKNAKIVLLDIDAISDTIFELSKISDLIIFGTDVYDKPKSFNMNNFDMLFYRTDISALTIHSKDTTTISLDLLKPIRYKKIERKIVNTEIDPWGEEEWDDSYFEKKMLNFEEYKINESVSDIDFREKVVIFETIDEAKLFYRKMSESGYKFYDDVIDGKISGWDSFIYNNNRFVLADSKYYVNLGYTPIYVRDLFKDNSEPTRIRWFKKGKLE